LINNRDVDACKQEAERLISQYGEFAYSPYAGKASGYIVDTVQTVLHYFFNTDSFESCLIATVNQGDDADTTGALAGMLAGALALSWLVVAIARRGGFGPEQSA
jgi:ADP-ribosyl-[dinitrogen reductase] hydrolase